MATITSAQTGYINNTSTWVGGVVPGNGDIAIRAADHLLTVPEGYTWTIGTDPDADNYVISGPVSGSDSGGWLIESGAEVILKGSWLHEKGTFEQRGKITVQSTNSQRLAFGYDTYQRCIYKVRGTSNAWAEVDATGCGGNFKITNSGLAVYDTFLDWQFLRLKKVYFIEYQDGCLMSDVIFDSACGNVTPTYRLGANHECSFTRVSHLNPDASFDLNALAPDPVETPRDANSLIVLGTINAYTWTVGINGGVLNFINPGAEEDHGLVKNALVRCSNDWNAGTANYENVHIIQTASDNQHGLQFTTQRNAYWRGGSFQAKEIHTLDLGDAVTFPQPSSSRVYTIEDIIELPNRRWFEDEILDTSSGSGTLFSLLGNSNTKVICNGNTHYSPASCGETTTSITDQVQSFKNNLCYGDNLIRFLSGSIGIDDIVSDADYNSGHWATNKYSLPTNEGQYLSTPGLNDLDDDPLFYDNSRGFHSYAFVLGYLGTDYDEAWDYTYAAFCAINDPDDPNYNPLANAVDYNAWLKQGWAPTNPYFATAGSGGDLNDWIGFSEPETGNTVTVESDVLSPINIAAFDVVSVSEDSIDSCQLQSSNDVPVFGSMFSPSMSILDIDVGKISVESDIILSALVRNRAIGNKNNSSRLAIWRIQ